MSDPCTIKDWQFFYEEPKNICFTHDVVREWFMPFFDSKGKWIEGKYILDTVREMAEADTIPVELDYLEVVWIE